MLNGKLGETIYFLEIENRIGKNLLRHDDIQAGFLYRGVNISTRISTKISRD